MTQLTFSRPAACWEEALPLGNGRMGAMVFGGIAVERINLNEDTVWYGGFRIRMQGKACPGSGSCCGRIALKKRRSWRS